MSAENPGEITQLLEKARNGDKQAENRLAELIMPELKKLASFILSREYRGNTMETGDLVNAIYLKLRPDVKTFNDSAHFKAYAARAMHNYLIDRARRVIHREKHLGERAAFEEAERFTKDADGDESVERATQLVALAKALQELRESDERAAQIVVLRMGGLTNEEIAVALGLGERTVIRDWRSARALIVSRLS